MRLTLRTLLAWLDDTLPPEEVREIGAQVSETPYAQQLVERIRKVSRRRRLTVPPANGADAVDPNTVSAYLDNELDADNVAEYEKLCLGSDVHLAEAASCHQILSLIKNKAKVPPEARYRMYRLFKGPEAVRTSYRGAAAGGQALAGTGVVPSSLPGDSEPPWAKAGPEGGPALERLAPPTLAVVLIAVLAVVGWLNLRYADDQARVADADADADAASTAVPTRRPGTEPAAPAGEAGLGVDRDRERIPPPPIDDIDDIDDSPDATPDPDEAAAPGAAEEPPRPAEPAAPLPEGMAAVVEEADGIALRATRAGTSWEWQPLRPGDALPAGARVVNLAPFRTTLRLGAIELTLVAQSEIQVEPPSSPGASARFALNNGSVLLRSAGAGASAEVGFEGRSVTVEPPAGQPVGISWLGLRALGQEAGRPMLTLMTPSGTLTVTADAPGEGGAAESREFQGPVLVSFDAEDGFLGGEAAVMPRWVADPEPPPADIQAGEAFARIFEGSGGEITFALLEGMEGDDPAVRSLSAAALGAMGGVDPGSLELVLPLLNRDGAPGLRSAALGVLMARMARGPEQAAEVRELLARFTEPPEAAEDLARLLVGYGEEQVKGGEAFTRLVADLSSPNPSVRQLAIDTLRMLTGREALGYDPDDPATPGLKSWQDLLKAGRLAPAGGPAPGPSPAPAGPGPGIRRP